AQAAARDATASLRDALWRLGRSGQYRLEVVPPRQALCDGISAARCFQLLPTARPAHRVVVTPVRPMEGGYLVELRAAGFGPSGQQLFDAHVAEPPARDDKLAPTSRRRRARGGVALPRLVRRRTRCRQHWRTVVGSTGNGRRATHRAQAIPDVRAKCESFVFRC